MHYGMSKQQTKFWMSVVVTRAIVTAVKFIYRNGHLRWDRAWCLECFGAVTIHSTLCLAFYDILFTYMYDDCITVDYFSCWVLVHHEGFGYILFYWKRGFLLCTLVLCMLLWQRFWLVMILCKYCGPELTESEQKPIEPQRSTLERPTTQQQLTYGA